MRRQAGLLAEIPVAQASPIKRASRTNWAGSLTLYKQATFSRKKVLERGYNVGGFGKLCVPTCLRSTKT